MMSGFYVLPQYRRLSAPRPKSFNAFILKENAIGKPGGYYSLARQGSL
jgi:hypothetical protein